MGIDLDRRIFRELKKQIELLDPNHQVVKSVRVKNDSFFVEYVEGIKIEGKLHHVLEDLATAFLVAKLVNSYGYPKDSLTIEKRDAIATTATFKDCVVRKEEKHPMGKIICMICEVKLNKSVVVTRHKQARDIERQLLQVAHQYVNDPNNPYPKYLLYFQVRFHNDRLEFEVFTIDYEAYLELPESGRKDVEKIMENPFVTKKIIPPYTQNWLDVSPVPLKKGTKYDLVDIQDLQEINRNITTVKDLVWRGRRRPEKTFNFIVRIMLAKIYDEISTKEGEEYRFQIKIGDKENLSRFVSRINCIYQNAQHQLTGIPLQDAKEDDVLVVGYERGGPVKIEPQVLYEIVKLLQKFRLRGEQNKIDLLGEFFERFIWTEYAQSSGQFFTHPNLVRFTIHMLDLPSKFLKLMNKKSFPLVIDPSCGSGTFLVETMKILSSDTKCRVKLMEITEPGKHWAYELLYGIDTERDLVLTAKTNMIMHGDGSGNIIESDALLDFKRIPNLTEKLGGRYLKDRSGESPAPTKKEFAAFTFVLSNPPFSLPLGEIDKKILSENFVLSEYYGHHNKSKNSEVFFVERWYQFLKENGEIGVVLPESVFDTLQYLQLRIFLLTRFRIKAIVSLPEHAFSPFANQRTNLLFARKRSVEETRRLLSLWAKHARPDVALKEILKEFPEENYSFFVAQARYIGYFRSKKVYEETSKNDLSKILESYYTWMKGKDISFGKIIKVHDIAETEDLRMDVKFLSRNRKGIGFNDLFTLIHPEKIDPDEIKNLEPDTNLYYVETGSVTSRGEISYLEFKASEFTGSEDAQNLDTSLSNYERILKKIRSGRVVKFPPNTLIISPARSYQGKIAIIDKAASEFYYSPDFIALKPKKGIGILSAYLVLRNKQTVADLDNISRIGKGGYTKLRSDDLKYLIISEEALREGENPEKLKALKKLILTRKKIIKYLDILFKEK